MGEPQGVTGAGEMEAACAKVELVAATPEPLLVTFALFAYNQEKYIREAVEGAFSQTYEPLEIILSDDCSSDRTFEIMQEMAAEYKGPHRIRVRRSEVNFGTALHVYAVSKIASGKLLICASGDDISLPERSIEICNIWTSAATPVTCIHSAAFSFSHSQGDRQIIDPRSRGLIEKKTSKNYIFSEKLPFLSPTCAYSIDVFKNFDQITGGSIIEDVILALRSLMMGDLVSINKPLVYMRAQPETSGTGYSILNSERWNRFVRSKIIANIDEIRDIQRWESDIKSIRKMQSKYYKNIKNLSKFIVLSCVKKSFLFRFLFFIKYIMIYPTSARFVYKFADALKIAGLSDNRFVLRVISLCRRFRLRTH